MDYAFICSSCHKSIKCEFLYYWPKQIAKCPWNNSCIYWLVYIGFKKENYLEEVAQVFLGITWYCNLSANQGWEYPAGRRGIEVCSILSCIDLLYSPALYGQSMKWLVILVGQVLVTMLFCRLASFAISKSFSNSFCCIFGVCTPYRPAHIVLLHQMKHDLNMFTYLYVSWCPCCIVLLK